MLANQCSYGPGVRMMMPDMRRCNVLVAWGANPLHTNPVGSANNLKKNLERGMKLIIVDPRCTPTTELADIHLRPFPGTDGALALGGKLLTASELPEAVTRLMQDNPQVSVQVSAAEGASMGQFVRVIDLLNEAGLHIDRVPVRINPDSL